MRYALLTTSFPRFAGDPAGGFVGGMARALARTGNSVQVLCASGGRAGFEDATVGFEDPTAGLAVERVRYGWPARMEGLFYGAGAPEALSRSPLRWGLAPTFTLQLARRASRVLRRSDVLVSHWLVPSAWVGAELLRRMPRSPVRRHIAIAHGSDVALLLRHPWLARLVVQRLVVRPARPTELVFVGSELRRRLVDAVGPRLGLLLAARSRVEPMGVDPMNVGPTNVGPTNVGAIGSTAKPLTALILARLLPLKGVDVAIDALGRLAQWRLRIAGVGPERPRLVAQIAALGLQSRVELLGQVVGEAKHRLLREADAVLVPSRTDRRGYGDSTPTVIAEAWSAGLPVIASSHGGIPELVERFGAGAALLVPPGCPDALALALGQLAAAPLRLQMALEAQRSARDLTWSAALERIVPRLTTEATSEAAFQRHSEADHG